MTKAERIKEFNYNNWRILNIRTDPKGLVYVVGYRFELSGEGIEDYFRYLTEAKQIMEMKDDGGAK